MYLCSGDVPPVLVFIDNNTASVLGSMLLSPTKSANCHDWTPDIGLGEVSSNQIIINLG